MLVLGVDTGTRWGSFGLDRNGPLAEAACGRLARGRDPLLPLLPALLDAADAALDELRLVAVATGPGSFTSLRVGVSLAKGMALGLGLPLVGVPSLPLIAARLAGWPGTVCALVSDHPGRAYAALRPPQGALGEPRALDVGALAEVLRKAQPPVALVGPGAEALAQRMDVKDVWPADAALNRPSGLAVARGGLAAFNQRGADDLDALEPLYVAPPAVDPGALKR